MKKINLQCPIGYTGYGITSLNILKELDKISDIALFPIGNINHGINSINDNITIKKCLSNSKFFDASAPCLKIWHQHDLYSRIGKGRYYSFPFFELDTLSSLEVHNINSCDYIFTATNWSRDILQQNGVTIPIIVCPLGVDRTIFFPTIKSYEKFRKHPPPQPESLYRFFHIGKWEKRKSQDILLQCFENAFTENDNVELWLFPHNPFLTEPEHRYWVNMVKYNKLSSKINIFPRYDTQIDLANIIADCDCGVFISRAEGWNNSILEVMSMNKPCIVTNYSAHTHYCTTENSFLINIQEKEVANDDKWFFGQGNWAKIGQNEMDNIIETMRYVYNNNIRSNPAGIETSKKYSWANTAEIIYANT